MMSQSSRFILQSCVKPLKEIFLLDFIDFEEIGSDTVQSSLDYLIVLEFSLTDSGVKN